MMRSALFSTLLLALAAPPLLYADNLSIAASRDATLYEDAAGARADGSGTKLFAGRTGNGGGGQIRRALIAFDLSAIPTGSTIDSVQISVAIDKVPQIATPISASLHRLSRDWSEGSSASSSGGAASSAGDVTWLHTQFDSELWDTPGGDFSAASSAEAALGNTTGDAMFASTAALVADVQAWLDDPTSNFGWLLRGDESAAMTARRLFSREADGDNGPQLQIEFTPPQSQGLPFSDHFEDAS